MHLTNAEIINMINALNELSDKDIPVEFAFKVFGISGKLSNKFDAYLKTLQSIMKKAGVDNPEDPVIREDVENLLNIVVDFDSEFIDKQELIDSDIKLTLSQLARLDKLIKE